jgi:ankyrin repeat protein
MKKQNHVLVHSVVFLIFSLCHFTTCLPASPVPSPQAQVSADIHEIMKTENFRQGVREVQQKFARDTRVSGSKKVVVTDKDFKRSKAFQAAVKTIKMLMAMKAQDLDRIAQLADEDTVNILHEIAVSLPSPFDPTKVEVVREKVTPLSSIIIFSIKQQLEPEQFRRILKRLLDVGANPNLNAKGSPSPIQIASLYCLVPAISIVLAAGADPNAIDEDGNTALHLAAQKKDGLPVVQELLKTNRKPLYKRTIIPIDPMLTDKEGKTAAEVAATDDIRCAIIESMIDSIAKKDIKDVTANDIVWGIALMSDAQQTALLTKYEPQIKRMIEGIKKDTAETTVPDIMQGIALMPDDQQIALLTLVKNKIKALTAESPLRDKPQSESEFNADFDHFFAEAVGKVLDIQLSALEPQKAEGEQLRAAIEKARRAIFDAFKKVYKILNDSERSIAERELQTVIDKHPQELTQPHSAAELERRLSLPLREKPEEKAPKRRGSLPANILIPSQTPQEHKVDVAIVRLDEAIYDLKKLQKKAVLGKLEANDLVACGIQFDVGTGITLNYPRSRVSAALTNAQEALSAYQGSNKETYEKKLTRLTSQLSDLDTAACTAMREAMTHEKADFVAQLAHEKTINVTISTEEGAITPLLWASQYGRIISLQALLEAGANPKVSDSTGRTPLMLAFTQPLVYNCVKMLLDRGAELNVKDAHGTTVLGYLLPLNRKRLDKTKPLLKYKVNVCKLLLERSLEHPIVNELTPAATPIDGYEPSFKFTPLALAIAVDHDNEAAATSLVEVLLQHKANPNATSTKKITPLHLAATYGLVGVVQMLLTVDADPTIKNSEGRTALDVAATEEIRKILTQQKGKA